MKRHIVAVLLIIGIIVANNIQAQNKIGYISLQDLISAMPEYKTAGTDLQDYQKALEQQGNDYQTELYRKDSIFKADSLKWNASMKDIKRKELIDRKDAVVAPNVYVIEYLDWLTYPSDLVCVLSVRDKLAS